MARSWPLVERQLEYDTIRSALTSRAESCGVVLTGDAGVGKTTLARHATQSLRGDVRWVAGTESARSIPLGVFAHMVGASTSRDPVTFLSAARESLLAEGPIVIGVDDAHLLDKLSATLLHQLAIDRVAHIVATVRSGEAVPDAVTSLWKDGHLLRLDLSPFTKDQSVGFIESVIGGHLEGLSADLMWDASGGNALFLRHLVEGALEAGTLRQASGVWQLRGRAAITSELASLLESRVEKLPDQVLHALKLLTFCEPIDIDVLSELAGEEAVEDAERRGLVRIVQDGHQLNVRYNHPLFGDVIRRRLGVASSRRLRGQLVKALSVRNVHSVLDRIRLAELTLDSDQAADLKLLGSAAKDAIALANVPLGERFARAALAAGGGVRSADLLARALIWQGLGEEAEQVLASFDPEALDEVELAGWGLSRISNLFFVLGRPEKANEVLEMLRARVTQPSLLLTVEGVSSACACHENRLAEAVAIADRVFDAPDALPWAVKWASYGGGISRTLMGRGDEVRAVAAKGHAVEGKADALLRFPAGHGEVLALTMIGNFEEAQARAEEYLEFSSAGQYLAWGLANSLLGTVGVAVGHFEEAVNRLEQALAALASGRTAWSFPARIGLVQAYSALGRTREATRAVADAEPLTGSHVAVYMPQFAVAKAWLAAAEGMTGSAVELALAAAEFAAESGQHGVEAEALHAAARFGERTVAPRLAQLAEQVDGRLAGVYARHAAAVAADDGAGLDSAAADFEKIGALLSAADAAAQAASAHDRVGGRRLTVESAATANRLAAQCGGARTPALRSAAQPLPLTLREREIANLVAAGLTNRQIADRLVVSVRTVEGHLYRACTKLDVSDREGLSELMQSGQ